MVIGWVFLRTKKSAYQVQADLFVQHEAELDDRLDPIL